jgi:predicted nucleic acid-binding protein
LGHQAQLILDTSVIISGIFWKGAPFEILKAWQEHRFRLAITLPILNEYRRVLDEMTKKHPLPVLSSILEVRATNLFRIAKD